MTVLSQLIAKCDWNGVYKRIQSNPEEVSAPIPTGSQGKVYVLHQAICSKRSPVPYKLLLVLLQQYPNALDVNAFVGACQNPLFSRDSMEILIDNSDANISQSVQQNAQRFASMAVKRKNIGIVQLFIEKYPIILHNTNNSLLNHACHFGTGAIVEKILAVGLDQNIGMAGGLFLRNDNKEDSLDIAIRLYDETDDERCRILAACLQYANASKVNMKVPDPDYPIVVAAIGLVPQYILNSILSLNAHEISGTNRIGRYAIHKIMEIARDDTKKKKLPEIFSSSMLVEACANGKLELVQEVLKNNTEPPFEIHINDNKNALDVAINQVNERDKNSIEIAKICVQYANSMTLGLTAPPPNYPTILAGVGLVPEQATLKLAKTFSHEMKYLDRNGKFALKKALRMAHDNAAYAVRLDKRCMYPLSEQLSNSISSFSSLSRDGRRSLRRIESGTLLVE